jgi:hypothetical protein
MLPAQAKRGAPPLEETPRFAYARAGLFPAAARVAYRAVQDNARASSGITRLAGTCVYSMAAGGCTARTRNAVFQRRLGA